jgi:hypothetical protein
MTLVEKITWLLVVITVIGSVIIIIGNLMGSLNVATAGKTTSSLGVFGLIITLIVYLKIRHLEVEEQQLKTLDKLLT